MVQNVASQVAGLEPEDFYLLSGIEHGMRFSKWVSTEKLPEFSRLDADEIDYRLDRCMDRDLIKRKTIQYTGYRLTFEGYDALALRTFSQRETIDGVGAPLGVGKESDVYEVRSYKPFALKFHREGYTNFREVQKEREYTADKDHRSWMYTARKAAEREYEALSTLFPSVRVPRPIDHNRHAIVMEKLEGVELSRAKLQSDQVQGVIDLILTELALAYEHGYVHADISEYNITVGSEGIMIFDWPQAVPVTHENSTELLTRDVDNLMQYFHRKYPNETPSCETNNVTETIISNNFSSITQLN